jgi:hypothetical protein
LKFTLLQKFSLLEELDPLYPQPWNPGYIQINPDVSGYRYIRIYPDISRMYSDISKYIWIHLDISGIPRLGCRSSFRDK